MEDHRTLIIQKPDDWHTHLRADALLKTTLPHTASQFARAIVMPNLNPPITTQAHIQRYRQEILSALKAHYSNQAIDFTPLMTLYLTQTHTLQDFQAACMDPHLYAVKLYPQHATTHSAYGVSDLRALYPLLEILQTLNKPLLIHGEVTDPHIDIFDREAVFIEKSLLPLLKHFPKLKMVLEHITTQTAVDCVKAHAPQLGATITPHHLLLNRNDLLSQGIKPHYYCLPILKTRADQEALQQAAISGHPQFFAGSDSAPHAKHTKEHPCGCAGIYHGPHTIAFYAYVFETLGALSQLEPFLCHFGADFYGLPRNRDPNSRLILEKRAARIPSSYPFGEDTVIPLWADQALNWSTRPFSSVLA
jgi:dihydroorotase